MIETAHETPSRKTAMKQSSLITYHQLLADLTAFCESNKEVLLLDRKQNKSVKAVLLLLHNCITTTENTGHGRRSEKIA